MSDNGQQLIPEPWSPAAVRLLQGAVYADEQRTWELVLGMRTALENYFCRLGLLVVVDETEGLAYLRQMEDDDYPQGSEPLPRLFRRAPLGYGATLLCVLLRDALRRFEEDDVDNERCVVETEALRQEWAAFFPDGHDQVRQNQQLLAALRKLEEIKFVRRYQDDPESWEVRRIVKARLPVSELETLKSKLQQVVDEKGAARS